jgi:hypothetical protein
VLSLCVLLTVLAGSSVAHAQQPALEAQADTGVAAARSAPSGGDADAKARADQTHVVQVNADQANAAQANAAQVNAPQANAAQTNADQTNLDEANAKANQEISAAFAARQADLDRRAQLNDYRYGVARHNCYSKWLVNYCLDKALDVRRATHAEIRKEQLALDAERRAQHALERDRQAEIKRVRNEAEAPQRAEQDLRNQQAYEERQRQHALDQARRDAEAPQRAANQRAYDQKQAEYQRKLDDARRQGAAEADQRAANARKFEEKQQRAKLHAAEIEARKQRAAQKQGQDSQNGAQQPLQPQ